MKYGKLLLFAGVLIGVIAQIIRISTDFKSGENLLIVGIVIGLIGAILYFVKRLVSKI